jgi:hypothetical protein
MKEGMRNTTLWKGLLRAEIGNLLYVDMTCDDEVVFVGKCEELCRRIAGILHFGYMWKVRSHCSIQVVIYEFKGYENCRVTEFPTYEDNYGPLRVTERKESKIAEVEVWNI